MRITKQNRLDGEAIGAPALDNLRCMACQLYAKCRAPFAKWETREAGQTAIISAMPLDILEPVWYDIRKLLFDKAGLTADNVALIPATLCYPYDHKVSAHQLRMCKPFIVQLLNALNPARILIMGGKALAQVWPDKQKPPPIKDCIGRVLDWNGTPMYVTYDPNAALAGKPAFLIAIQAHVLRMMKGPSATLPPFPGWRKR
jgi:hypothetical protein